MPVGLMKNRRSSHRRLILPEVPWVKPRSESSRQPAIKAVRRFLSVVGAGSVMRRPSLGIKTEKTCAVGSTDTALGDQCGYQPGGSDVERQIERWTGLRHHSDRLDGAGGGQAGHVCEFRGRSLL